MEDRWRTQAGMVLHALEASLGDAVVERAKHVANLDANVCKKIRDRKPRSKWFDEHAVLGFVRAAYLDELAALYIAVVKDTEYRDGALALQKLIERLDILSIRNSVAHPTHPFLESYWYRVAALATDPIIEILSLSRVHRAARKAITGTLEDIPDEWIQKSIWKLPNNLPDVFDHDITGLVGRHSERRAIKKHILNPRIPLLAVVAAGGIGKTALVLDTLHQLSRDPSTADAFDLMLFISAKQEVLTVDGIVTLSAPQTIAEIEDAIASACAAIQDVPESADSFAHLKMHYGGDRLLICIDNLETILRDAPAAFVQFHESLPPGWKLLVTSRIAIDGATCLPLSGLSNGDAMMLARIYAERRGLPALSQPQVEQIAQAASNNPLATRLIVDAFARGRDIPTASGYMRAKVGEFAFANLLEALPDKTLLVLESLRLSVVQSREQICSQTGLNPDEVAEAIGLLGRTSLIQRREGSDGETYQLSEAINDFLLVHPNAVKLRESLLERVRSLRNLNVEIHVDQEEYQITQYDWKFLPSDTPARLTAQLGLARRTLMRRRTEVERIIATKSALDEIKPLYGDHPAFCSYYARVLELLKDPNGALEYLRSAVEKSGRHLRYELQLARLLHDQNEFDRALAIYEDCRARGLDEPEHTDRDAARRIVTGYFLALLFGGRYERVMQETKNWKKHPNFRRFLGTFRASAIKRDAERGYFDEKLRRCGEHP